MLQWEYKREISSPWTLEEYLNRRGADGWELVQLHESRGGNQVVLCTFKRPKLPVAVVADYLDHVVASGNVSHD